MKCKAIMAISCIFYLGLNSIVAQNIVIPDPNFKLALISNPAINTNGDAAIQYSEAQAFTGIIDVSSKNISDLKGIEEFIGLGELNCYDNNLSTLDVSSNTQLERLACFDNNLNALNVTNNLQLQELVCSQNTIASLDVSNNTNLVSLACGNNLLTTLDVRNNLSLITLECSENTLVSLDVSNNILLEKLLCEYTQMKALDVSNNTALKELDCGINELKDLDLNNNTALEKLDCSMNQLMDLDLNSNTLLTELFCSQNSLQELDVSLLSGLLFFVAVDNQLQCLNLKNGNNSNFLYLDVKNNLLSCIEVDNVTYSTNNWVHNFDIGTPFNLNCVASCMMTALSPKANVATTWDLYPNPTTKEINLDLARISDFVQVKVYDTAGKLLSSDQYKGIEKLTLEIDGNKGVYFIQVETEEKAAIFKIVKM
jgi:hypothetical protein